MPFIRMFDHNPALFPFWGYRNGGEPILASPEHFYLLGYLLDWGKDYSSFLLNVCLFLLLMMLASSAYVLGRYISRSNILATVYAIGLSCNGIIIQAERSARFQSLTIITLTLVSSYLFLSKNKHRNWLIPVCIMVAIYNGVHYGIFPIASLFMLSIFSRQKAEVMEVIQNTISGVVLSLPFILPVFLHPMTSGVILPDQLTYQISTVGWQDFVGMFIKDELYHFVGYQAILILPLLILAGLKPYRKNLIYLLPIVPWLYFIVAGYSEEFKSWIENTPISNWRHNMIFYKHFMMFSMLFVIGMVSTLKKTRNILVMVLITSTSMSYINTFSDARAEFIDSTKKVVLHNSNNMSIRQQLFEKTVKSPDFSNRVYTVWGLLLPEYRTFTAFSYFLSEGYWNTISAIIPDSKFAQRPHWITNGKRNSCVDFAPVLSYAGYKYLFCTSNITNVGYGYEKMIKDRWSIFINSDVTTVGLACSPDEKISKKIAQDCKQPSLGHADYFGDTIHASISLDKKSTIFFHENYAWGWIGWINNELHFPRKINQAFIGYDLEPGDYEVSLRYIDPFFVLGIFTIILYFSLYYLWHKFRTGPISASNSSI